jgi:hypothetical protein
MNKTSALFGICTLVTARLFGAGQIVEVTPQTLSGWQVSGAEFASLAGQADLTLPTGAQLSSSFASGYVAGHLVSRPFFGATPDDCPSLDVGPASLAFTRNNNVGQLVLIVGNGTPTVLPVQIPLSASGCSAQPLDVTLSFDNARGLATVAIPGQSLTSVSAAANGSAIEVAVAAGASTDWPLAGFDVVSAAPEGSGAPGNAASTPAAQVGNYSAGSKAANAPVSSLAPRPAGGSGLLSAAGGPASTAASQAPFSTRAHASLQVFTPPSARFLPALLAPAQPLVIATSK